MRPSERLQLNSTFAFFKAVIEVEEREIVGLLATVKSEMGSWFYLEVESIYQSFYDANESNEIISILPNPSLVKFNIKLQLSVGDFRTIDIDHIRFSPIAHDFEASIYDAESGKVSAVIDGSGSLTRMFYNSLGQEIAKINTCLKHLTTFTKTGFLFPTLKGSSTLANEHAAQVLFQPERGFYESFDQESWQTTWKIVKAEPWKISRGQLFHDADSCDRINVVKNIIDVNSAVLRLNFNLQLPQASLNFVWGNEKLSLTRLNDKTATLKFRKIEVSPVPISGEQIVMIENKRLIVWIDAVLVIDREVNEISWADFAIKFNRKVLIENVFVANQPSVTVQYFNGFGQKTQLIKMKDGTKVVISEMLYDSLGRQTIATKPTEVEVNGEISLLSYKVDFVTNKNITSPNSVWSTGKMEGEVHRLNPSDKGFPYSRITYKPNPLNQKESLGLPGATFTNSGPFSKKLDQESEIPLIQNRYPTFKGFRHDVQFLPNGSQQTIVFDKENNKIAVHVKVPGFNHVLATYEYDENNNLVKVLSPNYHEDAATLQKFVKWNEKETFSDKEQTLQMVTGIRLSYDEFGRLTTKINPDTGKNEFIHDKEGQKRFVITGNQTIYFNYDEFGQMTQSGLLRKFYSKKELKGFVDADEIPEDTEVFQTVFSSDRE